MLMSHSIHLRFILHYITLAFYYVVKGHIQMTSKYSTIDVKKEINKVRMLRSHSIHLLFILHCITLTIYYIVKDTLR